ncbi:MAG TPA: sodium:proton antiporter [Polyangia bacterium]|nr:sodium:proton antiporter [Polyangia bacterium]
MVHTPAWAVAPFVIYLISIAALPLFAGAFWEHNRNKLLVAALASAPVIAYLLAAGPLAGMHLLARTIVDYASFIALLGALFTISGGICLTGSLVGTPLVNTGFLAAGALLGSVIGTTGASVLLIRPLLRANARAPTPPTWWCSSSSSSRTARGC